MNKPRPPRIELSISAEMATLDVVRLHGLALTAEEILSRMPAYATRDFARPSLDEVKAAMVVLVEKGEAQWFSPNEAQLGVLGDNAPRICRPKQSERSGPIYGD